MAKTGGTKGGSGTVSNTAPVLNDISFFVSEDKTLLATIRGTDADRRETLTYSFIVNGVKVNTVTIDTITFSINPKTGLISTVSTFNYEFKTSYSFVVQVSDRAGATDTATVTVQVNDVNEFSVGISTDNNIMENSVSESAAAGTLVGISAVARDLDGLNNTISYSLVSDALGVTEVLHGAFKIDSQTGVISVNDNTQIDYEELSSTQSIFVKASSSDGSSSVTEFIVVIQDSINEIVSITDTNAETNSVSENAVAGSTIGITAFATLDVPGNKVEYFLVDALFSYTPLLENFQIDKDTGVISVADGSSIDYESAVNAEPTGATQTLFVAAMTPEGAITWDSFVFNITDENEFDVNSVSDIDQSANSITENAAINTLIGVTAFALDLDASNNLVNYSLVSDALGTQVIESGPFQVDATSGVVSVKNTLTFNYEYETSCSIFIQATSTDGSSSVSTFTVDITSGYTRIYGDARGNQIYGTTGDDIIYGLDGNDFINGAGGSDIFIGGNSVDSLYGNINGADIFRFLSVQEMPTVGNGTVDQIFNFTTLDRIDFKMLDPSKDEGDQALVFGRELSAFEGITGEVSIIKEVRVGASDAFSLLADMNGDRVADFRINISVGDGTTELDYSYQEIAASVWL